MDESDSSASTARSKAQRLGIALRDIAGTDTVHGVVYLGDFSFYFAGNSESLTVTVRHFGHTIETYISKEVPLNP